MCIAVTSSGGIPSATEKTDPLTGTATFSAKPRGKLRSGEHARALLKIDAFADVDDLTRDLRAGG